MKFMTGQLAAGCGQKLITICDHSAIAQGQPVGHDRFGIDRTHHGLSIDTAAQIKQAGTLGNCGHTELDSGSNLGAQPVVRRQLSRVHFRKSATQIKPGCPCWKLLVGCRVEDHGFAASGAEQFIGLGVAERKGTAGRDGDHRPSVGGRSYVRDRTPRLGVQRRRL